MQPLFDNNIYSYKDNGLDYDIKNEIDYINNENENDFNLGNNNISFLNDNIKTSFSSIAKTPPKPLFPENSEELKTIDVKSGPKKRKIKNKKHCGRKRKQSDEIGIHNKYFKDNIFIKIKCILFANITICANELIYEVYDGKIGVGIFIKMLKK